MSVAVKQAVPVGECDYITGNFVAVVGNTDEGIDFWIAKIHDVRKNSNGDIKKLHVIWYEAETTAAESEKLYAQYKVCYKGRTKLMHDGLVDVDTIMCVFDKLNSQRLEMSVRQIIESSLYDFKRNN